MKEILTYNKDYKILVDDQDFDYLNQFSWYVKRYKRNKETPYFYAYVKSLNKEIAIYNLIMNPPFGFVVDHKNGNTIDNTRANLRLATTADNNRNVKKKKGTTSKYKGVSLVKKTNKWYASIKFNGKSISLGHFDNEIDAAKTYDKKALELFGEFARINFNEKGEFNFG